MTRILTATAFAAGLALSAGAAQANLMINGGTAGLIPAGASNANNSDNDFLDQFGNTFFDPADLIDVDGNGSRIGIGGFFGAFLTGTGPAYKFEFFGSEAGYNNQLIFGAPYTGTPAIETGGGTGGGNGDFQATPLATFVSSDLDFIIRSWNGTTNIGQAENSANGNPDDSNDGVNVPNFFLSFGDDTTRSGRSVWLFLDDGGAQENDNHDDMVLRISVVPLPPAVLMLGLGLAGMAGLRRMQARPKAA